MKGCDFDGQKSMGFSTSKCNQRDTKIFNTQREAQNYARDVAINQRSEVIVQGRNGSIRSKDSYGNDPCPPKDTEH